MCTVAKPVISRQKKKEKEKSEEENIGKVSDNDKNKTAAYRFLKQNCSLSFSKR